jgi:hypothetical protein
VRIRTFYAVFAPLLERIERIARERIACPCHPFILHELEVPLFTSLVSILTTTDVSTYISMKSLAADSFEKAVFQAVKDTAMILKRHLTEPGRLHSRKY